MAIIQIVFWLIGAMVIAYLVDTIAGTSIWTGIISMIDAFTNYVSIDTIVSYSLLTLIMFIGGFVLYASIFSIIGAVSNENTNTQQFSIIATLPLLLTFLYMSRNLNSSNCVIDFLSIFPLSSPIALLATIPHQWSWTYIISSVCILYACDILLIEITSQLYKYGNFNVKYLFNVGKK